MSGPSPQQVIQQLKQLRYEQQQFEAKLGEMEVELNEHRLVAEAIKKVEGTRRCYRLVGGVLVERTASEVLPAVENNAVKLVELIKKLEEQLKEKNAQADELVTKYKIRYADQDAQQQLTENVPQQQGGGKSAGVLI